MIDPVFAISIIIFLAGSALLVIRLYYIRQNGHTDERARRVHEAADELNRATNDLRSVVKGISESPDPLRELIRSMQERGRERGQRQHE